MLVGEGWETTLAGLALLQAKGLPEAQRALPISLVNSRNFACVDPKSEMMRPFKTVIILQDVEPSHEGARASIELAQRCHRAGWRVLILVPLLAEKETKADANDLWKKEGGAIEGVHYRLDVIEPGAELTSDLDAKIEELNQEWFISSVAGKAFVVRELYDDELNRNYLTYSDIRSFKTLYAMVPVEVVENDKPKLKPLGDAWLTHPKVRIYRDGIVFKPSGTGHVSQEDICGVIAEICGIIFNLGRIISVRSD